jgi:predicted TIM-barrel fold metal-dependent hydrolase
MRVKRFFDSLTHPSIKGEWLKGEDSSYKALEKQRSKLLCEYKACAVNMPLQGMDNLNFYEECGKYSWLFPVARVLLKDLSIKGIESIHAMGFKAIKIHPRQLALNSLSQLYGVFEYCYKHEITVFLCTYYYCESKGWPTNDFLSELAKLNTLFPLKLVLLHGGGVRLLEFAEFVRFNENVLLDLSLTIMKYKGSSLDMDIKFLLDNFDRRICLGSDHPEYSISDVLIRIDTLSDELKLSKVKLDNIAYNNLNNLLGM